MSEYIKLYTDDHLPSFTKADAGTKKSDTEPMTEITRYELDAKLETIEARMDGRVASIESKIDVFLAAQAEREKAADYRFGRVESDVSEIKASLSKTFSSLKSTMIVTVISAVVAIVIGVAGFNAMLTSNMIASFQMGKGEISEAIPAPPVEKPQAQTSTQPAQTPAEK